MTDTNVKTEWKHPFSEENRIVKVLKLAQEVLKSQQQVLLKQKQEY